jgi:hypothetical protein
MDTPNGSVQRFGVRMMGKPIEWGYVDPVTKELATVVFHPKVGVTFEEILEFQTVRQELAREIRSAAREMQRAIDALDKELIAQNDPDEVAKMDEISRGDDNAERDRFARQVDSALMLIVEDDRRIMEPLLRAGHPNEIRELINHLQSVVITKTAARVEAVAQVDPTSPPAPADSSSTEDSGPDSESKAEPISVD